MEVDLEIKGIDPFTSRMLSVRSTIWAKLPKMINNLVATHLHFTNLYIKIADFREK